MKPANFLTTAALLASYLASAAPSVTVIPLNQGTSCYYYPGAGPLNGSPRDGYAPGLNFVVDSADRAILNGWQTDIQNVTFGSSSFENMVITFAQVNGGAPELYDCYKGVLRDSSTGREIRIRKDFGSSFAGLGYTEANGYSPDIYKHAVDGKEVDGLFLGAQNQTTWGFRYRGATSCGETEYVEMKLLGLPNDPENPPTASDPPAFTGFLRVVKLR